MAIPILSVLTRRLVDTRGMVVRAGDGALAIAQRHHSIQRTCEPFTNRGTFEEPPKVPDLERVVPGSGDGALPVRGHRNGSHASGVAFECVRFVAGLQIPDLECLNRRKRRRRRQAAHLGFRIIPAEKD